MKLYPINNKEWTKDELHLLSKKSFFTDDINKCDYVVSLSLDTIEEAYDKSRKFNKKLLSFIDYINPWEVFYEDETENGFFSKLSYRKKIFIFIKRLKQLEIFDKAEIKFVSTPYVKTIVENVLNKTIDCRFIKRGYNLEKSMVINNMFTQDRKYITIYTDMSETDKMYHAIRALQYVPNIDRFTIIILSDKKDEVLKTITYNSLLNIKFIRKINKYEVFKKSKFIICLNNKELILESLFYNTNVIAYKTEFLSQYFGNSVMFVENNSIIDLSNKITTLLYENEKKDHKSSYLPTMENFITELVSVKK